MKKILIVLAALMFSTSAMARDFHFPYEPSELSTPSKLAALHSRLEISVKKYCAASYRVTRSLHDKSRCMKSLVSIAIEDIDDRRLVAYVQQQDSPRS